MERFDYLAVGVVTHDLLPAGGHTIGGTVSFSSRTAVALGCRTAVVTTAGPDCDLATALPGIPVHCVPAGHTTTFQNIYTPQGRQQYLHATAGQITAADIPVGWDRTPIVHLAPLANDVNPAIINLFSNSMVGITPQGWMRAWDDTGRVFPCDFALAAATFPLAAAVIISEADLPDTATLQHFRQAARLLVMTQGPAGCTLFFGDETRQIPAPATTEVESTGAGDIFATGFLIRLHQTGGNPWDAARFANEIAAQSVTQASLAGKIQCLAAYHQSINPHPATQANLV